MTYTLQLNARARFVAESFLTPVRPFLFLFATTYSSHLVRLITLHRAPCCFKVSVSGLGAALHRRFPKIPIRSETFTTSPLPWMDIELLPVKKDERFCLVPHLRQPSLQKVGLLGVSTLSFNPRARSSRNQHLRRHLYNETVAMPSSSFALTSSLHPQYLDIVFLFRFVRDTLLLLGKYLWTSILSLLSEYIFLIYALSMKRRRRFTLVVGERWKLPKGQRCIKRATPSSLRRRLSTSQCQQHR